MLRLPALVLGTSLFVLSCVSSFAAPPPDAGGSPNPDNLLKAMSTRLASTRQYRFTATRTIPQQVAAEMRQRPKADVEVVVRRPDQLAAKITGNGKTLREIIFDGRTFTVVDGVERFYSKAALRGSLNDAVVQITKIYGFQPPLAEFVISDAYGDLKHRVSSISYLGKDTVRQGGRAVECHRIGLNGKFADAELWLGIEDRLPRRLKAAKANSGGKDVLVEVNFLTWDLNPSVSGSVFTYQPPSGTTEIPMVALSAAKAVTSIKSNPKPASQP